MYWGILGPLQVRDDTGTEIALPTGRVRVLLAALLIKANHAVSVDELGELLWDGEPPSGAARTVQVYVVRLRRALGPSAGTRIVTRTPGYLYQDPAGEDEFDLLRFESRCRAGSAAVRAEEWTQAADLLAEALRLWRGTPLADVPSESLRAQFVPGVEQLRLQALEDHIEADLHLGRTEQVVPQLRDLASAHPLRERFHAQLMTALAVGGRRAEALAAYQRARQVLVDELGIEPGPELRTLHERILAGESDPIPAQDAAPREPTPVPAVPRQLPTAVRHFTGRQAELDTLTRLLDATDVSSGTVVISAIDGMAGIGKTALAVHVAHRLSEKFPDGQLFLDLHGYTQGQPPRTADEALTWLLRALGVPPERIPTDSEQAAALYRQHLADTRTLIVLDNAAAEAQVRPLLPGTGSCLVLVTSRKRLKALDDAHHLSLDLLSPPDAIALLRAVAGVDRIPSGDRLAGEVAELCGYLPLALRIAASLLRHRPAWNLEHLADRLRDQHQRVRALSDGERELAAVFDLSYASLGAAHRQLWRRLGLVPGPDLDAYAATALAASDPAAAAGLLEDLVDHNLLTAYAPGRYRLHDLLRVQARTLAATDPAPERESAQSRLLHYYAHTAQSASAPITRYPRPQPDGQAAAHTPALSDPDTARAWLRTEHPNLEAAFSYAHASGLDEHAIALAAGLAEILQADGHFTRAREIHQTAVETAERMGHPAARATALTDLGRVRYLAGDTSGAGDALVQALEIFRTLDDRLGEANALTNLGRVRHLTGNYPRADNALTRALEIYHALGNRLGEATALTDLGKVRYLTGDYSGAGEALTRALELYQALDNRLGEANALTNLGRVRHLTGNYPGAEDALTRALEIFRALGNRLGEANALSDLGRVRYLTGDYGRAGEALTRAVELNRVLGNRNNEAGALAELGQVRHLTGDYTGAGESLTRALEIFRALGYRGNEAWALNRYAATLAAAGERPRALAIYQQALAMNRELNNPDDEAIALEGIAEHHLATGEPTLGTTHLHQALEIYQRLGMTPDTHRVQDRLDGLAAAH